MTKFSSDFSSLALNEAMKLLTSLLEKQVTAGISGIFAGGGRDNYDAASMRMPDVFSKGTFSVVINNNAPVSVTAQETSGAFNEKYLEITIDQMVANSMLRGRQTSGVMQSLFGIVPNLIGR